MLDRFARVAAALLRAPTGFVSFIDENNQWLMGRFGVDVERMNRSVAFCAHTIMEDRVLVVEDASLDPRFANNLNVAGPPFVRFYAGAPLRTPEGHNIGALSVMSDTPREGLSAGEQSGLRDLADLVVGQLRLRRAGAHLDPATGLPNRTVLEIDLAHLTAVCRSMGGEAWVMVIDAAEAREFNDLISVLSHSAADALLAATGERLRKVVPQGISIYFIGSFRFTLLISNSNSDEDIRAIQEQIVRVVSEPVFLSEVPITFSPCVGAANYPRHAAEPMELIRSAVTAVVDARQHRRRSGIFEVENDARRRLNYHRLIDLNRALTSPDQLSLHFQPKLRLAGGTCSGVEALVRWAHPVDGPISPGEFVPLAERTGMVRQLTGWVMRQGIATLAKWQSSRLGLSLALNISARDLEDPTFPAFVENHIVANGIDPTGLELEITESAFIIDPEAARAALRALRHLGLRIAVDDYGTSQSSLAYLRELPVTSLKIDQMFVSALDHSPTDQAIVQSTLALAKSLGLEVVAEGIETEAVCDMLRAWECDYGQGYVFARPMPEEQFLDWLTGHP